MATQDHHRPAFDAAGVGQIGLAERQSFRVLAKCFGLLIYEGRLALSLRGEEIVELGTGSGPLHMMNFRDVRSLARIVAHPQLQLGETYMEGGWDTAPQQLDALLAFMIENEKRLCERPLVKLWSAGWEATVARHRTLSPKASRKNAAHHYDLGNDLYSAFLDSEMNYSCAFWDRGIRTLEEAQRNKVETTLRRLEVGDGATVLDIGCGWGAVTRGSLRHGAAQAVGLTLSEQQAHYARQHIPDGAEGRLSYRLEDYRDHAGANAERYDRIVSVGMLEHVGLRQFETYFRAIHGMLKPGGKALVHSIARNVPGRTNAWVDKYIFPGGYIPWEQEITESARKSGLRLVQEPFQHPSIHYARTLGAWRQRFNSNFRLLDSRKYDDRFRRMWNFYLAGAEVAFLGLGTYVVQVLLERD